MKFGKFAILASVFTMSLASCEKDNPTPEPEPEGGNELTASVLTITPETVVVDLSAADAAAVTFSWTSASEAEDVDYTLYLATAGNPIFEGWSVDNHQSTSLTMTNRELHDLLLSHFGAYPSDNVSLQASVTASLDDDSKTSATVAFAVTLGAAEIVKPETLYMMGGALETGWDERVALPATAEGVYKVENITLKFGLPEDNRGFKFYVNETDDVPVYGQNTEEGAEFGDIVMLYRGDSQFYPMQHGYESGIYTIEVDLNQLKLTLTKTEKVDEFIPTDYLYILGDNLEYGWSFEEGNALAPIEENEYEGKNILLSAASSFKIYGYDWSPEYIRDDSASGEYYYTMKMKESEDSDTRFVPGDDDAEFQYGYYTVNVNLNTMKITLTLEKAIEAPDPSTLYYIVGEHVCDQASNWSLGDGGNLDNALYPVSGSEGVYEGKNIALTLESSFKFDFSGWSPEYIRDAEASEYWTMKLSDDSDTRFKLSESGDGFEAGLYTVRIDLNTLKVTLTKQEEEE